MAFLPTPCLCLVTSRNGLAEDALVEKVLQGVIGGVNMVQVREKNLPGGHLLELGARLRHAIKRPALLIFNERVDVALACGADGIQLAEDALPVHVTRHLVDHDVLIGKSVHSVESAVVAAEQGADFLVVGTIYETRSKPGANAQGLDLLRAVGKRVNVPYLAIGGINESNVAQAIEAGASGVAVISALLDVPDTRSMALKLRAELDRSWAYRRGTERVP